MLDIFHMSKGKPQTRGYVRPSRRHGAREQIAALVAAGVDDGLIYTEGKTETLADCLQSLRPGDTLAVTTLARLHNRRDGILAVVYELAAKRVILWTVENNKSYAFELVDVLSAVIDAMDELANDKRRMTKQEARRAAQIRHGRTPTEVARRIWEDTKNFPTVGEALAHPDMDGWLVHDAYRKLKARGTQVRAKS